MPYYNIMSKIRMKERVKNWINLYGGLKSIMQPSEIDDLLWAKYRANNDGEKTTYIILHIYSLSTSPLSWRKDFYFM